MDRTDVATTSSPRRDPRETTAAASAGRPEAFGFSIVVCHDISIAPAPYGPAYLNGRLLDDRRSSDPRSGGQGQVASSTGLRDERQAIGAKILDARRRDLRICLGYRARSCRWSLPIVQGDGAFGSTHPRPTTDRCHGLTEPPPTHIVNEGFRCRTRTSAIPQGRRTGTYG